MSMLGRVRYLIGGGHTSVQQFEDARDHEDRGSAWREKWQALLTKLHLTPSEEDNDDFQLDVRLSLLLKLYAHHPAVGDLRRLYEYEPEYVIFYLPQLCNFLLNGSPDNRAELLTFIFEKCRRSLTVAHRVLWFLLAFGRHAVEEDESFHYHPDVEALISRVCEAGALAAQATETSEHYARIKPYLLRGAYHTESRPQEPSAISDAQSPPRTPARAKGLSVESTESSIPGSDAPLTGTGTTTWQRPSTTNPQESEQNNSNSQSDTNKQQEGEGTASGGSINNNSGIWRDRPLPRIAPGPPHVIGTPPLRWSEGFFAELSNLSTQLKETPEDIRNRSLRASLRSLRNDFIPNSSLYIPVKSSRHMILNIIDEESFCFKTKERVPFLICFEIVDFDMAEGLNTDENGSGGGAYSDDERGRRELRLDMWTRDLGDRIMDTMERIGTSIQRNFSGAEGGDYIRQIEFSDRSAPGVGGGVSGGGSFVPLAPMEMDRGDEMGSFTGGGAGEGRARNESNVGRDLSDRGSFGDNGSEGGPVGEINSDVGISSEGGRGEVDGGAGGRPNLGQFTPAVVNPPRGAGFDHFQFHKDHEFEGKRDRARRLAQQQLLKKLPGGPGGSPYVSSNAVALGGGEGQTGGGGGVQSAQDFVELDLGDDSSEIIGLDSKNDIEGNQGDQYKHAPVGSNDVNDEEEGGGIGGATGGRRVLGSTAAATTREEQEQREEDEDVDLSSIDDLDSQSSMSTANIKDTRRNSDDDSMVIFKERWAEKEDRLRKQSRFGSMRGWRLVPVIVKSGDDLRQEQFASQLIKQFASIFAQEQLPLYLRPYDVLAISPDSGLIEAVPDTISLDSLRKNDPGYLSLRDFFQRYFGKGRAFRQAQRRFCESLAAYCIVCYLLQIKDRHNGNLLLHADGHIIHIDFGFLLSNAPGNVGFETAPFKLTTEFVQLLGGPDSSMFARFRSLCVKGFMAARKHRQQIILLVEMMLSGNEHLPCFYAGGRETVNALQMRFCPTLTTRQCREHVNELVDTSLDHWRTRWYDQYQRCCVGIW